MDVRVGEGERGTGVGVDEAWAVVERWHWAGMMRKLPQFINRLFTGRLLRRSRGGGSMDEGRR